MAHTSDRDRLPEAELLKLHGLRLTVEPYPNGIRALAVYQGDDRLYHGAPQGARVFVDGYDVGKSAPVANAELDPRLSDLELLRGARSILEERGQDTENLSSAIWSMEARECPACDGYGTMLRKGAPGGEWCQDCDGSGLASC